MSADAGGEPRGSGETGPDRGGAPAEERSRVRSRRWDAAVVAAVLAGAAGMVLLNPVVLLAAVVPTTYAAYAGLSRPPEPSVVVGRTLDPESPLPGDAVTVTVAVRNAGDRTLADVRVVDGVPAALGVVDGSPRHATALRPGEEETFEYVVRARRGEYAFDPATVVLRGASGAWEVAAAADPPTRLVCRTLLDDLPVARRTIEHAGRVTADTGGSGIEFYATRDYRPGDPMSRIDWNRLARTSELTTVEFREQRAVTVVVVLDARAEARRAASPDEADAVDLSAYAADRALRHLLASGHRAGVATLGDAFDWVGPGAGRDHRARAGAAVEAARDGAAVQTARDGAGESTAAVGGDSAAGSDWTVGADGSGSGGSGNTSNADGSPADADSAAHSTGANRESQDGDGATGRQVDRLRRHLPGNAQVLLLSPATDDVPAAVARRLEAYGHPVTLLSPDVTGTGTVGGRVAAADRGRRLRALRDRGTRVVDWSPDEPLSTALARAVEQWLP